MPIIPFTCMHDCTFCMVTFCPQRDMQIKVISSPDSAGLVVTDTETKEIIDYAPTIKVSCLN